MHCSNGIVVLNKGSFSGTRYFMSKDFIKATLILLGSENADIIITNELKITKTKGMIVKIAIFWYVYLYIHCLYSLDYAIVFPVVHTNSKKKYKVAAHFSKLHAYIFSSIVDSNGLLSIQRVISIYFAFQYCLRNPIWWLSCQQTTLRKSVRNNKS